MFNLTARRALINKRGFHLTLAVNNDSKVISDVLFKSSYNNGARESSPRLQNIKEREKTKKHVRTTNHKPHSKRLVIKWSSGTAKQQAAASSVLEEIMAINPKGKIKAVNPEDNTVEEHNIREYLKGIDLNKLGITVVRTLQNEITGEKIPMIKEIQTRLALKNYSNKLSKIKEQELLSKGVGADKIGRRHTESKSDANCKNVKVSWQISDYDLNKQKHNEITSHLRKGLKVALFVNEKDSSNVNPVTAEELSESKSNSLTKKERNRREEVLLKLKEMIADYSTQVSEEGSIFKRMIIKVTPNLVASDQSSDKRALKDQRKKERLEKLNKRLEKKRLKEES